MAASRRISFAMASAFGVLLSACAGAGLLPGRTSPSIVPSQHRVAVASGVVVDDPSGQPLAGIPVHVQPWKHGCVRVSAHGARCPGNLPWHAVTDAQGRFELRGVPRGAFLLVIGSDSPSDVVRPTIHDRVLFEGRDQRLSAPELPAIPCIYPREVRLWCQGVQAAPGSTPFPRPAVERGGNYRLTTLSPANERPCLVAFNRLRARHGLPQTVADEWLTENAREDVGYRNTMSQRISQPTPFLSLDEIVISGGNSCNAALAAFFATSTHTGRAERDPRVRWLGAVWRTLKDGTQAGGQAYFPIDIRSMRSPRMPWP